MYESNDKMVSHPDHYQSGNGLEVIDVIEAFTADLKGAEAVCTGNALKYICRWKKKNGIQDIKKAIWYLTRLIEKLEKTETDNKPNALKFKNIAIVDSDGVTQNLFLKDWMPYIVEENNQTFTVAWLMPGGIDVQKRTYCKLGYEYRLIEEGE